MRAVIQRTLGASLKIDDREVASTGSGLVVFLGVEKGDGADDVTYIVRKLTGMRVFPDAEDKTNLSILDVHGEILLVSQFTLCADLRHGRRPDFFAAAGAEEAVPLYESCIAELRKHVPVSTGVFGADMKVSLINDGPFTLLLDSRRNF